MEVKQQGIAMNDMSVNRKRYIAFDTETEKGKAFLMTTAKHAFEITSFLQWVSIMAQYQVENQNQAFTVFNIEYDVSALLKYLPQHIVKQIYLDKEVEYRGLRIRYIAGKFFSVRKGCTFIEVFDIFPFFQTSLDNAAQKFLNKRKIAMPKTILANLTRKYYRRHKKQVDKYGIRDAQLTQGLTDLICDALEQSNIPVDKLYSPGYIAKCYLAQKGLKIREVPERYIDFVKRGYYGARIETVKRGFFPKAYVYDIKSAYPYALSQLPNFAAASYYYSKKPQTKYFFAEVKVWSKKALVHLLPYRTKANLIVFPHYNGQTTVLTNFEYEYLKRHNLAKVEFRKVLNIRVDNTRDFKPIIEELYLRRKESAGLSILFKLILNSMYGIFAERKSGYQTVGLVKSYFLLVNEAKQASKDYLISVAAKHCPQAEYYYNSACACNVCNVLRKQLRFTFRKFKPVTPVFNYGKTYYQKTVVPGKMANMALAAMITAFTRVQIFDYIRQAGDGLIAAFTDSVLTTAKLKIPARAKLGELELQEKTPLLILGCGVYETANKTKSRGFRGVRQLRKIIQKQKRKAVLSIAQNKRVSLGILVRRPLLRYETFNEIQEESKSMRINFDKKRNWDKPYKVAGEILTRKSLSQPLNLA